MKSRLARASMPAQRTLAPIAFAVLATFACPAMSQDRLPPIPKEKYTEAQQKAWNDFADALRANAKQLSEARGAMMQSQAVPGLVERLDQKERSLSVLLDGARAIKSTFGNLYGELDDEQKKTAEELTPTYLGHTL